MKFACFIWIAFLGVFFCACTEKTSPTLDNEGPLKKAQSLYEEKKWQSAAIEFDSVLKSCNEIEEIEARLGSIVCRLLDKNSEWEEQIKLWKVGTRGYWHGMSFTVLESISLDKRDDFDEVLKKTDIPFGHFLLIQFLLLEGYENSIPLVVEKMPSYRNLAWDLLLLTAWQKLKEKQGNDREALFDLIYQNAVSPEQKAEATYGILLGNFFSPENKKDVICPDAWEYYVDLKKISFFRSSSPISVYQEFLTKSSIALQSPLVFCDLLFTFGGYLSDPVPVWEKGILFLESHKPKEDVSNLKAVCDCLKKRFSHAMGWSYLMKGDFENAQKHFLLESQDGKKEKEEIALALIAWKQGTSLVDIVKQFSPTSWKEEYFLGGRKVSFYRLPSREAKREEFQKLWNDPIHKIAFLFLDIFCLTGDGRSAHILLDQIVSEFPEEIYSLYMAEEENIPRDPYAENQIWEKLD